MRYFVTLGLFLFTFKGVCQEKPNIIFILIDDQRYDFLSFLDHPWIETPHIDELARRSIYFDQAFVTTSLCSPSRASIVTGMYAHTHGVMDNDTPLPPGLPSFPSELQSNGYHTAFIGKWHMGGNSDAPRAGFDHWVSFRGQGPYNDPELNIDGTRKQYVGYTPDILTDHAIDYIKNRAQFEQPYCLFLSHKSIHEDFTPAPRHEGRYRHQNIPLEGPDLSAGLPDWTCKQIKSWHGSQRAFSNSNYGSYQRFFQRYSECMLGVDESVGALSAQLKELGALDSTVIIYFSDNGYMMGEKGLIDKRVMYDESIRVPAFIHWPAKIPPSRSQNFFLNIDIAPTILDIAGVSQSADMHGESILPVILGTQAEWRNDFLYEYFIDPNAVQTPTTFGVRTHQWSYMTYEGVWDIYELYDLQSDPRQHVNLLGEVSFGWGYGPFLKFVKAQKPNLYPKVEKLDKRLTELLSDSGGSRNPNWVDKDD